MNKSILKTVVKLSVIIPFIWLLRNSTSLNDVTHIIFYIILGIVVFNLNVQYFVWFKPYFMSRYNFLTTKTKHKTAFDFQKEILYEKILEVFINIGFNIQYQNQSTCEIFVTTPITWESTGDNIYITMETKEEITIVNFYTASFGRNHLFKKNENNYEIFLAEFEKSLII